jgi:hypothetical protein
MRVRKFLSNKTPSTLVYAELRLSTVMLVKLAQLENALSPIAVTEEGMLTLVKLERPTNALFSIVVTGKP